jgi:uncharacterized protein involved in high-affinity Fe2+ transport
MTWRELKEYIEQQDQNFLDSEVNVYDYNDGSEYGANVTELLLGEDDEETGWVPYLTINQEEEDEDGNKNEIENASID